MKACINDYVIVMMAMENELLIKCIGWVYRVVSSLFDYVVFSIRGLLLVWLFLKQFWNTMLD